MAKGNELIPTDAPQYVIRPHRRAQNIREAHQYLVAHRMTINIVDRLKTVKVDHQKSAVCLRANPSQFLLRRRFVEQSRKRICACMPFQTFNLLHRLQDIPDSTQKHIGPKRFAYEIHRSVFKAPAFRIFVMIRCHEHERNHFLHFFLKCLLKLQPVHTGHPEVRQHHVGTFASINFYRFLSRRSTKSGIMTAEHILSHHQSDNHIIDNQDFLHIHSTLTGMLFFLFPIVARN